MLCNKNEKVIEWKRSRLMSSSSWKFVEYVEQKTTDVIELKNSHPSML